jgi:hypothetical protein
MNLEKAFDAAMFDIYRRAKDEAGYTASVFLKMLHERGGLSTAKYLINAPQPSDGYTHLYERGHLDLTVEAAVVEDPRWHALFTPDEIHKARKRLSEYGYKPRTDGGVAAQIETGRTFMRDYDEALTALGK